MEIVLASRNKKKIAELERLLSAIEGADIKVLSLDDIGFVGDIEENGSTFEENAFAKAYAVAKMGYVGLGDDSGLSVNALGGEPGIYSARYAGEHGNDEANNRLLLEKLEDKADRSAEFVCVIACVFPDALDNGMFCRGATAGVIIDEYRGEGGFGYDPLFLYEPMNKTFAQMSAEEKNSISHRGKAIELLAQKLKNH